MGKVAIPRRSSGSDPGRSRRGLSGYQLKIIAGIMLCFQVASTAMIPRLTGRDFNSMTTLTLAVICELVSWAAIPIYAWLLVEGYRKTASQWSYLGRLMMLALICEVPYDLVTFGKTWDWLSQNPVWALVLGLIVLRLVDLARDVGKEKSLALGWILGFVFVGAGMLWALLLHLGTRQGLMPIGALTVGFVVIFYLLEAHENTMMMLAGLVGAAALVAPAVGVAFLHYRNETLGYDSETKRWACYAIYPLELGLGIIFSFL